MTIPNEIPFASVLVEDRLRKTYTNIEDLADGIRSIGLIHPLILEQHEDGYRLVDGGRRHAALTLIGVETLYHATTCDVHRPGFVLRSEASDPLMSLLSEISANHDREDVPWQEELPAIVRAWQLIQAQHHLRGEEIAMRAFGHMLGVSYHDLQAAVSIWDTYQENPARFADCTTVRAALAKCIRDSADALAALHQVHSSVALPGVPAQSGPQPEGGDVPSSHMIQVKGTADVPAESGPIVPLSQMFRCCNSLEYMATMPKGCVNHIITDPDYAVSKERMEGVTDVDRGIAQDSVEDSLSDLQRFIELAFHCVDDHGFCVFFMDFDHWEKMQAHAIGVGWRVQRWPAIWRKADYRSNQAPQHNFCKNMEPAMILRKPGATLVEPQVSSVFEWATAKAVREFNHPFAKPTQVWRWFYQAICHKGQTVYDPFMGSGSGCVAAIEHGLAPLGTELSETHFANALINIKTAFQKKLGSNVRFI